MLTLRARSLASSQSPSHLCDKHLSLAPSLHLLNQQLGNVEIVRNITVVGIESLKAQSARPHLASRATVTLALNDFRVRSCSWSARTNRDNLEPPSDE